VDFAELWNLRNDRFAELIFQRPKRVEYLQISDCQLFKKIQLTFDHIRTPLKSELNFNNQLIINNLTKYNSLQTFSGGQGTCISDDELAGRGTKEENRISSANFPLHSQPSFLEQLIINNLQKQGCFWVLSDIPKDSSDFYKILIINTLHNQQMDIGWKNAPHKNAPPIRPAGFSSPSHLPRSRWRQSFRRHGQRHRPGNSRRLFRKALYRT